MNDNIAKLLKTATYVIVTAGAGCSVDSNLLSYNQVDESTFLKEKNLSYRDVSSPDLLVTNPRLFCKCNVFIYFSILTSCSFVDEWSDRCVETYRAARPHEGYGVLLRLLRNSLTTNANNEHYKTLLHSTMRSKGMRSSQLPPDDDSLPGRMMIATTNVDSMFLRAGFEEKEVYQMHGSYETWQCSGVAVNSAASWKRFDDKPCCEKTWRLDVTNWQPGDAAPKCRFCKIRPARPSVYMFGDSLFAQPASEVYVF